MWTTNFDWSSIFSKNHFITRRFVSSLLSFFSVKNKKIGKCHSVFVFVCVREQVFNVRPDNQNYYRKKIQAQTMMMRTCAPLIFLFFGPDWLPFCIWKLVSIGFDLQQQKKNFFFSKFNSISRLIYAGQMGLRFFSLPILY